MSPKNFLWAAASPANASGTEWSGLAIFRELSQPEETCLLRAQEEQSFRAAAAPPKP